MWVGSKNGLNKYDGAEFSVYSHDPDNIHTISHNYIWNLLEDSAGILWVGTWGGGLNKFDPKTETFTHYRHDPKNPHSISSDSVILILLMN